MKRKTILSLLTVLCLGSSMTAFAAPEVMPDGAVFDAEYYAQNNPDVVAEMGTEKAELYKHFTIFGKNEGRLPFSPDAQISEAALPDKTSDDEMPIEGVLGAYGTQYTLPSWGWFEAYGDEKGSDGMKTMTVCFTTDQEELEQDMQQLAQYTVQGYEWRPIQVVVGGEFNDIGRWWPEYTYRFLAENSDDWKLLENPEDIYMYSFKVTQDGKDYTECKFASIIGGQVGEVHTMRNSYFLVPKNYTGNLFFIVLSEKSTQDGLVTDETNAVTYIL